MLRPAAVATAAAVILFQLPAWAQTSTVVSLPPSQEVSGIAPQLVAFAGSQTNFDNLVNGLALGVPVTLSTTLPDGSTQLVTFTPSGGPLDITQIARTLEAARQSLISNGIATATAQQIAVALMGGTIQTARGAVPVIGLLSPATSVVAAPVGSTAAAGGTTTSAPSPAAVMQGQTSTAVTSTTGVTTQVVPGSGSPTGTPATGAAPTVGNISNSPNSRPISDTPPSAGATSPTAAPSPSTAQQPGAPLSGAAGSSSAPRPLR